MLPMWGRVPAWCGTAMSLTLLGSLAALALIDSTSIGTMLLPVWFLLSPRGVRVGRYLLFIGTIAVFYTGVGIALLLGGRAWLGDLSEVAETTAGSRVLLVIGLAMLVGSFFIGRSKEAGGSGGPGRFARWRDRAVGSDTDEAGSVGSLIGLALLAGTLEVASMLPYLGAIGLLATSDLAAAGQIGLLVAYCGVMVLPAIVLLALRLSAQSFIEPQLKRLAAWMERTGGETTAWIVGIVGFLIARSAAGPAGLTAFINDLRS